MTDDKVKAREPSIESIARRLEISSKDKPTKEEFLEYADLIPEGGVYAECQFLLKSYLALQSEMEAVKAVNKELSEDCSGLRHLLFDIAPSWLPEGIRARRRKALLGKAE